MNSKARYKQAKQRREHPQRTLSKQSVFQTLRVSGLLGSLLSDYVNRMHTIMEFTKKRKGLSWKGLAREETILQVHLIPRWGFLRLNIHKTTTLIVC
jgi:hypothetical protein